jgi:hypothetical protein
MTIEIKTPLRVEPAGEQLWRFIEDYTVVVNCIEYVVPKGFVFDGASIPRFLWRVCGCPLEQPRVLAAALHDYLYSRGGSDGDRLRADQIYRAMLKHLGISGFCAGVEYYSIRCFGGSHFGNAD